MRLLKITFKIHISRNLLYRLSVSADMEKFLSVIYRYRPIRKFDLSVVIGIGRYGKKHIDRTLLRTYRYRPSKKHQSSALIYLSSSTMLKILIQKIALINYWSFGYQVINLTRSKLKKNIFILHNILFEFTSAAWLFEPVVLKNSKRSMKRSVQ